MENKKHILIFNRSFWPDLEATGQFFSELCSHLTEKYEVTVIVGRSYYVKDNFGIIEFYRRQRFYKLNIIRVHNTNFWKGNTAARIINWFTYGIFAFFIALKIKPDIVIAATDPPFLGIISIIFCRIRNIPFIYNYRDMYLDTALAMGKIKRGFLSQTFEFLDKKAFSEACFAVPIGLSMSDRLKSKGYFNKCTRVIADWADTSGIKPVLKENNPLLERFGLKNKFVIMYSGNISIPKNLKPILYAINTIEDQSSFYLVFVGEGTDKENLRKEARKLKLRNIIFLPYQPLELLSFSLSMADIHLVSFKKGLGGATVPSKVYGIMAAGRPYIAITDKESEPTRIVQDYGCGLWVAPDDIEGLAEALKWAMLHPDELVKMGNIAREIAEMKFSKNAVIKNWLELLEDSLKFVAA